MRILSLRQNLLLATFAVASSLGVVVGCSGGGGGVNPTPTPTPCSTIAPQLSVIQAQIFSPTCALSQSCHASPTASGQGLDLSSASQVFVTGSNVTAAETFNGGSIKRLVPGSKATSYLYLKITGATGISQLQMPSTGQALDTCQIDAIGQWIDNGMLNN